MGFELSEEIFRSWIGKRVVKKSRKPFKSGNVVNTVKRFGLIHPITNRPCFEFEEDDSYVEARRCVFQL